jgi:hypothetical protein
MLIKSLSQRTNLSAKTIRYYEKSACCHRPGVCPTATEIMGKRPFLVLNLLLCAFTWPVIGRHRRNSGLTRPARSPLPCGIGFVRKKADEISRRIAELQRMEVELRELHQLGETFPTDDVDGKTASAIL